MWRLRRRAAGRCTGPYAGAAVGAMCGPCRRRASGDAAVARVVVCTDARPLVRTWTRGGRLCACMMFLMLEQSTLLFVGRQSCGVWLFHGLGSVAAGMVHTRRIGKSFDFSCDMVVVIRWAAMQFVLRVRRPWVWLKCRVATAGCNSCFIKKRIPLHQL